MKRKVLALALSAMMVFSSTGFAFADSDDVGEPPSKPKVESYKDNDKVKEYNKEAKEYNKKVDEYNAAVDKKYEDAVADTNKKNAEGQAKQEASQKAHDEAVAANEAEQARADSENAKIDEQNAAESERVNKHNSDEDAKVEQSKSDKEKAESENANRKAQYDADVKAAEKEYEEAVNAEKERIEAIKAENEQIRKHNAEEDQKVADTEAANKAEKERIDTENAERESKYLEDVAKYEADMNQYNSDYAQYEADKAMEEKILAAKDAEGNQRYHSVEEYNEVVKNYNAQVERYNGQVENYNKVYGVTDEIANNAPSRNKNAPELSVSDTYEIIKGDTESGRKIPVHIEHTFYGTDISYSEDFEIDANDTIILRGMASPGDNLDEQSCYFFYNTDDNHSLGMWANSWSELTTYPSASVDQTWENGDSHTISYKDSTNEYQWNFEDISISYYYMWTKLYQKRDLYEYANVPNEPTKPTEPVLELLGFEPIVYNPNYLEELDETENIIEKRTVNEPEYLDVPEIYSPQYEEYIPIEHVSPVLVAVPDVEIWENLPDPEKEKYLNRLPLLSLLPVPTNPTNNTPTDKTTPTQTIIPVADNNVEVVNNNDTPTANVNENEVPLAYKLYSSEDYWALLNLILVFVSIIIAICLIILVFWNNRKEDEHIEVNNRWPFRIVAVISAIVSAIVFLITEDMSNPMVFIDQYTLLMAIITCITALFAFISLHREEEKEDEEN